MLKLLNVAKTVLQLFVPFTVATKTTKDDAVAAKIDSTLTQIHSYLEVAQMFRKELGTPGADAAKAVGDLVSYSLLEFYDKAGMKLDDDKAVEFKAITARIAGDFADAYNCLKKK